MRRCDLCGGSYEPKQMQQKYCSPKCSHEARRQARRLAYIREKKTGVKRGPYKTHGLYSKSEAIGSIITCTVCGKQYSMNNSTSTKYCSTACRLKHIADEKAAKIEAARAKEEAKKRLDNKIKEAMERHVSYGELQRLKYIEECRQRREAKMCK